MLVGLLKMSATRHRPSPGRMLEPGHRINFLKLRNDLFTGVFNKTPGRSLVQVAKQIGQVSFPVEVFASTRFVLLNLARATARIRHKITRIHELLLWRYAAAAA